MYLSLPYTHLFVEKKNKNQKNYSQPDFSVQTWEINEGELKVLNYTGWLNEYKY